MGRNKTSSEREFLTDLYKEIGEEKFNKLLKIITHCPSDIGLYDMDCENSFCHECWRKSLKYNAFIGGVSLKEE